MHSHFLKAPGDRYGDFVVTKHQMISELDCLLRELIHLPTGAQVMHIANDDPENLFALSFKTYPSSSNGAAHILEHTVLCGSEKFPIKDPFFAMGRRSLNTFMNALTGADFTCYPAASQNEKDFYNLMDVYLDAVFHPKLKKVSFLQEGHRLEFSNPTNSNTPLVIRGIVFNEMKGSMASADTRLWQSLMQELLPDLPYAYNSGGDPKEIPDLTYEELLQFHQTFYHPSRCLYFFYGNLPLRQHLDVIAEKALKNVEALPPIPPIPRQQRFDKPIYKTMRYPSNEAEESLKHCMVCFGYLTAPLVDQEDVLALTVLDSILMETDASPVKAALLASELCIQVDAFIDLDMSEVPYAIVCKGCDPANIDALEQLLYQVLQNIVKEGIPLEMIDTAIHQLELSRLEIAGDHAPFGLTLFMRSALAKQHGCDPENTLMIHALFKGLLAKVKDPGYFTHLIEKYFLNNSHRVRLVMSPDAKLSSEEIEEEKQLLRQIRSKLTPSEIEEILTQTKTLEEYQKQTEDQELDCLPKVTLDDVSPLVREFPLKIVKDNQLTVYNHDCFTNHLVYADLTIDLPDIGEEDLPYAYLLASLLPQIGCKERSFAQNLDYLNAHTGGILASLALHVQANDASKARPTLSIRGKALASKKEYLLTILSDTLQAPRFDDKKRIGELLKQLRESQLQKLQRSAMRYASYLSLSGFSSAAYVVDSWHGLRYFKTIEEIVKDFTNNLPKLIDKLVALKESLFTLNNPELILSCPKEIMEELQATNFCGLSHLTPTQPLIPWEVNYPAKTVLSQGRIISSQLSFISEGFKTVPYFHPHAPALMVAATLFENKVLHSKIREQGGAYGCGANYSSALGYFNFHSYRDPNIASTLDTFQEAIEIIAAGKFTDQDLQEAKLGIIQNVDTPISPANRALTAYCWQREGRTKQMRQQFRDRLLSLTPKELIHAVTMHLLPQKGKGVIAVFAGKELLAQENALLAAKDAQIPVFTI